MRFIYFMMLGELGLGLHLRSSGSLSLKNIVGSRVCFDMESDTWDLLSSLC